jgi:hypothetical protein
MTRRREDIVELSLASAGAREAGITRRDYQVDAARRIATAAGRGQSSELQLPTGTGKTLVANFVALLWRERRSQSKVLMVAPRRALALQHNRYAAWAREFLDVLIVTSDEAANPGRLGVRAERAAMLIGLPGILSGAMGRPAIPESATQAIDLVIIDEFDEFLHQEYTRTGISIRFDKDFDELRAVLPANVPTVLMSGTSPNAAYGTEAQRLAAFVQRVYRPKRVLIPETAYAAFIPKVRLRVHYVFDREVIELDGAVGTDLMFALNSLGESIQAYVDTRWLFPRLPLLLARLIKVLRLTNGRMIPATAAALGACAAIQAAVTRSLFLQEDMLDGYEAAAEEFFFKPWDSDEVLKLFRPRFVNRPADREYYPAPRGKFATVLDIVLRRQGKPGVVFVRNIRLAEALFEAVKARQLRPVILHGELPPRDQDAAAQALGDTANLLVMVRETGKRGLDLPQADYAIFFSARASEVGSWQEFSRIRSTVSNTKDVYLLAYDKTREIERLLELLSAIGVSGREYEIVEE